MKTASHTPSWVMQLSLQKGWKDFRQVYISQYSNDEAMLEDLKKKKKALLSLINLDFCRDLYGNGDVSMSHFNLFISTVFVLPFMFTINQVRRFSVDNRVATLSSCANDENLRCVKNLVESITQRFECVLRANADSGLCWDEMRRFNSARIKNFTGKTIRHFPLNKNINLMADQRADNRRSVGITVWEPWKSWQIYVPVLLADEVFTGQDSRGASSYWRNGGAEGPRRWEE